MKQVDKNYIIAVMRRLPLEQVYDVAHECIELLGISEPKEYASVRGEKERTVYDQIKKDKIPYLKIDSLKLPCINLNL